ncbi:type VII secretion integral membrane protein EccD [Rhodococcus rhodnii]|uniref:Esx cluster integral membrane protein n=2 Tax=Rhodococcus rhodnii TaxID=38312 RepID=R7WHP4_9NOCA|nr:type VII secretion integral membrane protein EccD [Rhodococcus rhodnii]EOM74651.1 esx cluster integral membrane protein [Rhodococcus rhodnii LMG 5362]TXG90431.1 type VII secretion integral membrane protein EccD [Rhodococcus rhodnii]
MTITSDQRGFAPGPRTGGAPRRGAAPDLCRLTILAAHTQVDLAVPASVPLAMLIPGVLDTIRGHHGENDFDDSHEQLEPSEWVLAKIGQAPLSSTLTLQEHGIRDGDLLVLEHADTAAPPPLFDDIMYSVALSGADTEKEWSPAWARTMGAIAAVALTATASFSLLWAEAGTSSYLAAGAAFFAAVVFLVAGSVVGRVYGDTGASLVLGTCALPLSLTAGFLFVPGAVGAPHVLLGAALVTATAILLLRVSGVGTTTYTATALVSLATAVAATVDTLADAPTYRLGAGVVGVALLLLGAAPRLAILLAKLPLPPVPAPGTSVDPAEDDPDDARTMPTFDVLAQRAAQARRYLTGIVVASVVLTVVGSLLAARGENDTIVYWPGILLSFAAAVVLMFRGRTYGSVRQAVPLIGGGTVLVAALLVGASITTSAMALVVFGVVLLGVLGALALGFLAPTQSFSPVMRRATELVDLAIIATVLPLVCWVLGLHALMRGL